MVADQIVRELAACNASDPYQRKPWAADQRGKWMTVNVPANLWERIQAAAGVEPSQAPSPTDEQIIAAFLAKRPDWRQSGDWLVIGSEAPRELGDAIHTSDVIDAARVALALGVKEQSNG